jgi:hypothetical protein
MEKLRLLNSLQLLAAQLAHEANRAYCDSIGDNSQSSWDDSPEWQQESAATGVLAIWNNPAITAEQSHEGWLRVKEAEGWHYGPVKDPIQKTHPAFLPYKDLPDAQKVKDHLFRNVVVAVMRNPDMFD